MIITYLLVGALSGALASLAMTRLLGGSRLSSLERESVVVHTKDDRSIQGVLVAVHADCLVVGAYRYLGEAQPQDLPGEAVVPRANVSWLQRPKA